MGKRGMYVGQESSWADGASLAGQQHCLEGRHGGLGRHGRHGGQGPVAPRPRPSASPSSRHGQRGTGGHVTLVYSRCRFLELAPQVLVLVALAAAVELWRYWVRTTATAGAAAVPLPTLAPSAASARPARGPTKATPPIAAGLSSKESHITVTHDGCTGGERAMKRKKVNLWIGSVAIAIDVLGASKVGCFDKVFELGASDSD